jgi:hypothetical protein
MEAGAVGLDRIKLSQRRRLVPVARAARPAETSRSNQDRKSTAFLQDGLNSVTPSPYFLGAATDSGISVVDQFCSCKSLRAFVLRMSLRPIAPDGITRFFVVFLYNIGSYSMSLE